MGTKKWPPIDHGTNVITTQPDWEKRNEWTADRWASRKWGVHGTIIAHHDSHGLCYEVQHEDGTIGYYNPSEFEIGKSFEVISKEIQIIDGKIERLNNKKRGLEIQLQEVCIHPKEDRYRTAGSEVCGKCKKTLEVWSPRIGNPI